MEMARVTAFTGLCCGVAAMMTMPGRGAEMPVASSTLKDDGTIPQPLRSDTFNALLASSPFTRSVGVSDSLILTGVARFDDEVFATLLDTKTMVSQMVSRTPNGEGWQLMDVRGDPAKIETCTARIQIRGGEIVSIRYQEPPPKSARVFVGAGGAAGSGGGNLPPLSPSQAEEARKAAVNYREGFTSDGYPKQPPPEMVEKLSRLSVEQREDINRKMIGIRNQGLGMEERRRIYEDAVNRSLQSRR